MSFIYVFICLLAFTVETVAADFGLVSLIKVSFNLNGTKILKKSNFHQFLWILLRMWIKEKV